MLHNSEALYVLNRFEETYEIILHILLFIETRLGHLKSFLMEGRELLSHSQYHDCWSDDLAMRCDRASAAMQII